MELAAAAARSAARRDSMSEFPPGLCHPVLPCTATTGRHNFPRLHQISVIAAKCRQLRIDYSGIAGICCRGNRCEPVFVRQRLCTEAGHQAQGRCRLRLAPRLARRYRTAPQPGSRALVNDLGPERFSLGALAPCPPPGATLRNLSDEDTSAVAAITLTGQLHSKYRTEKRGTYWI
jgi:hypothetical protein